MSHTNELDNGVVVIANGEDLSGDVTFVLTDGRRMETTWDRLFSLEAELSDWEEREAACCPEDYGFDEVIATQTKHIDALEQHIAKKDEALRLIWDWCEDAEVKGYLANAAIYAPSSNRIRKMYADAKASREKAIALLPKED